MKKVLIPTYVQNFSCIGPECADTCCSGWNVTIDEKTFKRYKKLKPSPLKVSIEQVLKRNRRNPNFFSYGEIKLDKQQACPLLTQEGFCSIHAQLGSDYLSHTCSTYPRQTHLVDKVIEESLTLSCPEAARLALLNPNGIDFVESELSSSQWDYLIPSKTEPLLWPLRIASIRILQNRSASIEHRLITLGLFLQRIQEEKVLSIDSIEQHTATYENRLSQSTFIDQLNSLSVDATFQLTVMTSITNQRTSLTNKRFKKCVEQTVEGLQLNNDELSTKDKVQLFQTVKTNEYQHFIDNYEYVIENYLVNHVFKELFPFDEDSLIKSYRKMIAYFMLIKFHLVGMAKYHTNLNVEEALVLIQSFSRTTEHNKVFVNSLLEAFEHQGLTGFGHLVPLIQ